MGHKKELLNLFKRKSEGNGISLGGGTGTSIDDAIVIHAPNSVMGIMAEYTYIENQCGVKDQDWTLGMQSQLSKNGKDYDMLSVELSDGTEKSFYFDITEFFGKFWIYHNKTYSYSMNKTQDRVNGILIGLGEITYIRL